MFLAGKQLGVQDSTFWEGFEDFEGQMEEDVERLKDAVADLRRTMEHGTVAESTRVQFRAAVDRYKDFMVRERMMQGFRVWPANAWSIALYLRYIWKVKRSLSSMRQALAAIKWAHRVEGLGDPTEATVIKGLMRAAALELYEKSRRKHGLRPEQVKGLVREARRRAKEDSGGWEVVVVMMLLQYLATMRFSDVAGCKRRQCIFEEDGHMSLYNKGKNMGAREGEWRWVGGLESKEFCAVSVLREYLRVEGRLYLLEGDGQWGAPLVQVGGRKVDYNWYRKKLLSLFRATGLRQGLFGSHSFRSGSTTAALVRGAPRWLVKRHGAWRSDAMDAYFLPSVRQLTRTSGSMGMGRLKRGKWDGC